MIPVPGRVNSTSSAVSFFPFGSANGLRAQKRHQHGGNREAHGEEEEWRGMVESGLDHHERGAPDERAEHQREIGFELAVQEQGSLTVADSVSIKAKCGQGRLTQWGVG